jgi:phosphatidylserine/phosphatidylglycerophosphate/cardiolipin synthase-like enzyme
MIHLAEHWATELAHDCTQADDTITISALSLQPPRHPNGLPFSVLWQSWLDAAARGVSVQFFLPSPSPIHPATARNATAARTAWENGMCTRFVPQPNLLHAKSVIIDTRIVWIGSGNMTTAAAHHNHEIYIRFLSPEIAKRISHRWHAIANPA